MIARSSCVVLCDDVLPALSVEEYEVLKASIADNGVHVPIVMDQHHEIVDGKSRQRACEELGITNYPTITSHVENEAAQLRLRLKLNCNRRHLTREQKREMIAAYLKTDPQIGNQELGEIVGVSKNTVDSVRKELERSSQIEHFDKLRGKDKKFRKKRRQILANTKDEADEAADIVSDMPETPNIVPFKVAKKKAARIKRQKDREEAAANAPPWNDTKIKLHCCRFQDLSTMAGIEPGSVPLILTDPPYIKDWLEHWDELGQFAAEYLAEGGLLATLTGIPYLDEVIVSLRKHLDYQWLINRHWTHPANTEYLEKQVVLGRWRPILLFSKGTPHLKGGFCDTLFGEAQEKAYHDWQQPVEVFEKLLEYFSQPGDLVVDPCGGAFTAAVACYRLKRRFIGCDVDEQCVRLGWDRLHNEKTGQQWKVPGNVLPPKTTAEEPFPCTCRSMPRSRDVRQAELGLLFPTQSL